MAAGVDVADAVGVGVAVGVAVAVGAVVGVGVGVAVGVAVPSSSSKPPAPPGLNVTDTLFGPFITTVQVLPAPLHAPPQFHTEPNSPVAVIVTRVPCVYRYRPARGETLPAEPCCADEAMVSVCSWANVAVTVLFAFMYTLIVFRGSEALLPLAPLPPLTRRLDSR